MTLSLALLEVSMRCNAAVSAVPFIGVPVGNASSSWSHIAARCVERCIMRGCSQTREVATVRARCQAAKFHA